MDSNTQPRPKPLTHTQDIIGRRRDISYYPPPIIEGPVASETALQNASLETKTSIY